MSESSETPTPEPGPAKKSSGGSRRRAFGRRLGSTIVLWGLLGTGFWIAQPWMFLLMVGGMSMAGLVEFFHLFRSEPGRRQFRHLVYAVSVVYMLALFLPVFGHDVPWLKHVDGGAIALIFIATIFFRLSRPLEGMRTLDEITTTVFGFVYIPVLFGFLAKILALPLTDSSGADGIGHFYVLYVLAVTKFTDMGAYAIGSMIGKHKMVPHVSPGKTWQGFGGAIFGAFVASYGCLGLFGNKIPLITPGHAAILAVLLALVAILGDLAESILKRSVEAKDSGHKLPGIGGVLDLIDSVLFTAPVLYFYLVTVLL